MHTISAHRERLFVLFTIHFFPCLLCAATQRFVSISSTLCRISMGKISVVAFSICVTVFASLHGTVYGDKVNYRDIDCADSVPRKPAPVVSVLFCCSSRTRQSNRVKKNMYSIYSNSRKINNNQTGVHTQCAHIIHHSSLIISHLSFATRIPSRCCASQIQMKLSVTPYHSARARFRSVLVHCVVYNGHIQQMSNHCTIPFSRLTFRMAAFLSLSCAFSRR